MSAQQIILPFASQRIRARKQSNLDLIGQSYLDDYVSVTVVGVCDSDDKYVLVRREPGKTSPMLAWLMRSIFESEDKKMKRAA